MYSFNMFYFYAAESINKKLRSNVSTLLKKDRNSFGISLSFLS